MSSLKSRVLVSVVGVPLLLWVVLAAPTIVMVIALCVLAGIGAYELQQCVSREGKKELAFTSAIMAVLTVLWFWRGAENVALLVFIGVVLFFGFAIIKGGVLVASGNMDEIVKPGQSLESIFMEVVDDDTEH